MKKIFLVAAVVLISVPSFAADSDEEIPVVGLGKDHTPIEMFVKKKDYQKRMSTVISDVHDSTLPVLEKHDKGAGWTLRTVMVGLAISLEAGISPLFKFAVTPHVRVGFSNSKDPVLP